MLSSYKVVNSNMSQIVSFIQSTRNFTNILSKPPYQIALMNKSSHEKSTKNTKYLYEDENHIIRCESVD